ncbi:MerR family DNA-binding protein [Sandarakinorhabdus sp.]|jgi:MerR family transcriptional regulator, mercuric resistance operon regulatory protein|uniref:MerR family DNA-binding protein n=1 Tax=Sandarakinorhabdus sp. TaxID=1916663 RepID=UPI0033404DB2
MAALTPTLTIARLAAAGGVGVETVRFYQRKGLMPVPASAGAVRHYDETAVQRLGFIRSAQRAGFSLKEIAELLALDASNDRARVQALTRARLAALDAEMAALAAARAALSVLLDECTSGQDGPCPIIATFAGAACH